MKIPSSLPVQRALVLGGGGSTGNAWLIGVIAGLYDAGLDVTDADLVVGTSAGSTAAAQITAASPPALLAAAVAPVPAAATGREVPGWVVEHLERTAVIIASSSGPEDMRRRLAAAARELDASSDRDTHERWRATVAARLPRPDWPEHPVLIPAVDAHTGEPVVFDRDSGIDLADAVAASCASGRPHAIGGGLFIDGGYRRNENADLAAHSARVLVLSPFGGRTRTPLEWGLHLDAQVEELRAQGVRVEVVSPTPDDEHLFGANAMDVSRRPDAARAGHRQGLSLAPSLAGLWA